MIAVHSTDALLADEYRTGVLWDTIHVLFGFVAPAFIYFAGVTAYVAFRRRDHVNSGLIEVVRRYAWIIAIGVWLHIPHHSFSGVLSQINSGYTGLLDTNVLHLIGVSGLMCLALHRISSSPALRDGAIVGG